MCATLWGDGLRVGWRVTAQEPRSRTDVLWTVLVVAVWAAAIGLTIAVLVMTFS
jgi:hypothetical protein